jgi:O-antigen/teichoic acid export membrane protein
LGKSKLFILTGFISTLMNALLNILFIVVLKKGYSYLFLSICISNIIQILIVEIVVKCLNNISLKYIKIRLIKEIVKFSLPLGFNMICVWFLSSFNKLVIQKYIGIYYNGIYAISTKFGLAISLLANSFLLAWQENAFAKKGNKEEKRKYFDSRINLVIELLGYLTALIIPIVFIIFPIFIDVQYFEAKKYVPLYLIIMIIASFNTFLGSIFSNMFLTKKLFLSTFLGALLNIVICIPLVKMYKLNGANISLLGGYLFSILMRLIYLSNELGVKVNTKKAIIAIMLSAIGYTIYLSNNIYVNIAYILAITIILIKKKYFRYYLRSN